MAYRRVAGLTVALVLVARFVITDSSWGDSIASGAIALCAGVVITLAFRARWATSGELSFTWISVLLYAGGGTYLDHWSGDADIGGVVPFLFGLIGMVVLVVALNLPASQQPNRKPH